MRWLKIVFFTLVIFLIVLFVFAVVIKFISNPLWYDLDCGGLNPSSDPSCKTTMKGYRKTCQFFVCKKYPSSILYFPDDLK